MGASCPSPLVGRARFLFFVCAISYVGLAQAESWTIVPELKLSETYSTNMAPSSEPHAQGWISDVAPGIHIAGSGSRIKAHLDYRLDSLRYAGHQELDSNRNSLNSGATIEAIEKWLFLDASANVVQRRPSAFNAVAVDSTSATADRSETRTIQLSPYLRGQIADVAAYQMRLNSIDSRSSDATLANTHVNQWSGSIKNASSGAKIGWSLNGDASEVQNEVIGSRHNARLSGRLVFELSPQFHFSLSDGAERTNFATASMQTTITPGLGVEWSPSPRTQVAAQGEKRFFGTAHSLLLNHRTAWVNWRYTDVKDAANLPALLTGSSQSAISDLLSDLLTASIPDPVARAAAVRARFDQNVADLNQAAVVDGIQTSRLSVNHTREMSVALIGARNTLTLSLIRLDQRAIGDGSGTVDSFALSNNIRQQGGSVTWVHRLTPLTTLNYTATLLQFAAVDAANSKSNQMSQIATLYFHVARQSFVSLGARKIGFESTINGRFHEYAAVCSLTHRF